MSFSCVGCCGSISVEGRLSGVELWREQMPRPWEIWSVPTGDAGGSSSWDVTYHHLASTVIGSLCMWRSGTAHPTTQCHFCEELNLVVWFSTVSSPTHHLGWPHTLQVWYVSCLIPLAFSFVMWTSLDNVKLDDTRQFSCSAVWYFTGVFDMINSYCFSK